MIGYQIQSQASGDKAALPSLVKLVKDGKVSADGEEGVYALIGTLGGPKELTLLLDRAVAKKTPPQLSLALLLALAGCGSRPPLGLTADGSRTERLEPDVLRR